MQIEIFSKVKDPRVLGKVKHCLEDVLRIALIGVLCSCEDYDEISDLIEDRAEELKRMGFLRLTNGVPSGDTIRRVVESVNPNQMKASLAVSRENILSSLKGCHVIIDGKKLRGENPTSRGCNGLYILNAMVSDYDICVEEERVEDKTNELTGRLNQGSGNSRLLSDGMRRLETSFPYNYGSPEVTIGRHEAVRNVRNRLPIFYSLSQIEIKNLIAFVYIWMSSGM